jgi:hypothetical protein
VTCDTTDAAGNAATQTTFVVTVEDKTPPVIAPLADVGPIEATGSGGAVATYTSPATSDAVDGAGTATCAPASGSTFALGNTTVTCNATDVAGNAATLTTFSDRGGQHPPVEPFLLTSQLKQQGGYGCDFSATATDWIIS